MTKKLIICLIVISVLFCFSSCSFSKETKDTSLSHIKSSGVFRVGVSNDNLAPATFINPSGVWDGVDVTLARRVAQDMGVDIIFVGIANINDVFTNLNDGTIDCYWSNYTITSERASKLAFSIPYVRCNAVIGVKKNKNYMSVEEMKGCTIGYLVGSSSENAITSSDNQYLYKYLTFKGFDTDSNMYANYKSGTVDAIVADETYLKYEMQEDSMLQILNNSSGEPITINHAYAGVAFSRSSSELRAYINRELSILSSSGYLKEVCIKFFGEDLSAVNS